MDTGAMDGVACMALLGMNLIALDGWCIVKQRPFCKPASVLEMSRPDELLNAGDAHTASMRWGNIALGC
jgi:hypothetical protein